MLTFNVVELDLLIRGLFALQKLQPNEPEIQVLLDRLNSAIFNLERTDAPPPS
jgi:hypothetical protein